MGSKRNPHDKWDGGRHGESHRKDGNHHSLYRKDSHISWDTDDKGGYKKGSGHTTDHKTRNIKPWDK